MTRFLHLMVLWSVSALTSFCSLFWGCSAGMHVCVSWVLLPKLVKTVKSDSVLSLLAEMWGFFYYFFVIPVSPWAFILQWCPQGHSGLLGRKQLWPTNSNCEVQSIVLLWSCKSSMSLLTMSVGLLSWISACVLHGLRPHCIFCLAFSEALKVEKTQNFVFLTSLISVSLY